MPAPCRSLWAALSAQDDSDEPKPISALETRPARSCAHRCPTAGPCRSRSTSYCPTTTTPEPSRTWLSTIAAVRPRRVEPDPDVPRYRQLPPGPSASHERALPWVKPQPAAADMPQPHTPMASNFVSVMAAIAAGPAAYFSRGLRLPWCSPADCPAAGRARNRRTSALPHLFPPPLFMANSANVFRRPPAP